MKKCKDNDSEVTFSPNEKEFNEFLKKVKSFGDYKIINNNDNNQFIKSVIMQKDEFDFIKSEINNKLNKKIKEIKKLYQATVDGGEPVNFHLKCDNIPNTLVLIKSSGNRRFGGFTSVNWESSSNNIWKDDKNAFLFSLDKKKIYSYKNDGKAILCYKNQGPCFGYGHDIGIEGNPLKKKLLYTYENFQKDCSYKYDGDPHALSEEGKGNRINAIEYEVFQVVFLWPFN